MLKAMQNMHIYYLHELVKVLCAALCNKLLNKIEALLCYNFECSILHTIKLSTLGNILNHSNLLIELRLIERNC